MRVPLAATLRLIAPIACAAAIAGALTTAGWALGRARGDDTRAAPARSPASSTVSRFGPDGSIVAPPADDAFGCRQPAIEIVQSEGCARGGRYPACRWQLPEPSEGAFEIWRNTVEPHRWARPGLVSLVLGAAAEYRRRWPDDHLTIGDLDAPGPRHTTHDRGVDVDLYLTRSMMARNEGRGRYPDNYEGRASDEVELMRARVLDLAKILATCAGGRVRIYYNDPIVIERFRRWFEERGLRSDVGPAMVAHNRLHTFHFHLTVAEDLAPLEREPTNPSAD